VTSIERVRFPVVLFDLDGTLVDSGAIIVASMRHAARTVLEREVEEELLRASIGGPGLVEQMRALDPDRVDELIAVYRAHNEPLHAELAPCDDIVDVLPRLAEGRRLGVVTAKRTATVALAWEAVPIDRYFDVVVGWEDTERHKPDPDPVLEALRRLGARPEEAAYVGDSPFDVRAAKAAGVFAVAVGWGGIHDEARLRAEQPDAFVTCAEELLDVL
jgi:pyrophosphatase PpaX